ncbi:MAG: hypothetical protein NZ869_07205 [Thermoanaerobaculum sp.]|nr:hypothetical protein [Thermoanaerobaculum sp.]MDW7967775.1 hypothetical protein [Thermoanaerobaculum sp.]
MVLPLLLQVTVAVVQPGAVLAIRLPEGKEVTRWALPAPPVTLAVAPDGALWVPIRNGAATLVLRPEGGVEEVAGRLVPLFFRETDRFFTLFPGELAVLSYPELVRLDQWSLPANLAVVHAAVLDDGWAVALLAAGAEPQVILVFPFDEGKLISLPLTGLRGGKKVALSRSFLAVAGEGGVGLWPLGPAEGVRLPVEGVVVDLLWSADGEELFLLVANPKSVLLRVKCSGKLAKLPKPKAFWRGVGEPKALAASGAGLLVLEAERVTWVDRRGTVVGQAAVRQGLFLALLPSR